MTKPGKSEAMERKTVRERLAEVVAATERASRISDERALEILSERAVALARPVEDAAPEGAVLQVVTFTLGSERYALETRHVREIVRLTEITPLPLAPSPFVGIVNLRGEIVPLVDLGQFLGLVASGTTSQSSALVLGDAAAEIGILVTAVEHTTELPAASLLQTDNAMAGKPASFRLGVTEDALMVIDGDKLLADGRLFVTTQS
jgi:purine-binding chemotaxis protein CheW